MMPVDTTAIRARIDAKLTDAVRTKLADQTACLVRWHQNPDGSETPVWTTMKPTLARHLGLTVSSMADDYGPEPREA